jgi:cytochrome oxidase assembly protein ShyY1
VIDDLIESPLFRKYAPPVAGALFIVIFSSLAMWQLDRAAEKKALLELFDSDAAFSRVSDFSSLAEFERIQVDGAFLSDRQILIDNIVENGRPGYYVITPFRPANRQPLLLVNRGWTAKTGFDGALPEINVDDNQRTIRGLAWHLPRVGIRPGEAFEGSAEWPRVAVYPTLDEVATQLEETVLPSVMLLAPTEEDGFVRVWQPNVSGPMTHYGYAFQWLAMAAAVAGILYWNLRKRRQRD